MPNWCNNSVTLRHKDPEMIQRAYDALLKGELLNEFIPCPKELTETVAGHCGDGYAQDLNQYKMELNVKYFGYKDWYDWNVANWGTKWDVGGNDGVVDRINDNELGASFDSAWAPPVAAYERLCALGFEIKAYYNEPGMAFCGAVTGNEDSFDDEYYDYGGESSETVRDAIGDELDDFWCISENMKEWEEENAED